MIAIWSERCRRAWEGFWYAPGSARNLAAARVIVAAQALWVLSEALHPAFSSTD